ncbi:tetratricopeptide repeat protein [Aquimarina megaterium]|uniref:tetratricopeptide repeat protein n=1 Tax=Aquimarina megaterium TaxID=1443666 RepID=UPI00046F0B44|nr:tetratricopeptide repeat protein [Aquimarina megaterium]
MKIIIQIVLFLFLLLLPLFAYSQEKKIPDSLKQKSFEELLKSYRKYKLSDTLYKTIYSNSILLKAKQENNALEQARGYRLVSFNYFNNLPIRIAYLDSSIKISKNLNHKKYPTVSYSNLGGLYYTNGYYTKALESYLKALEYAEKNGHKGFYYITSHNIGRLKSKIGEDREAIKVFKQVLKFEDSFDYPSKRKVNTLLALANSFRKLKQNDSASYYYRRAIDIAYNNYEIYYYYGVLGEGINLYDKNKYHAAMDSIQKALPSIEKNKYYVTQEFIVNAYLYQAKLYEKLGKSLKSISSLEKLDQYIQETRFTSLESRKGYEMLIDYYKKNKDINNQLLYTQKLIKYDSLLYKNYKSLTHRIVKQYDTPNLLKQEKQLIETLSKDKRKTQYGLWITIAICVLILGLFVYSYSRQLVYKKRYNNILHNISEKKSKPDNLNNIEIKTNIGISEDIVNSIIEQLAKFEENHNYLSSNITISKLANDFKTNSKYISKVVNYHKKKSFVLYINELRIHYVTQKLKNDSKLRNYTLQAIAREIGFNTSESFVRSFRKVHGISPTYYIKKINN